MVTHRRRCSSRRQAAPQRRPGGRRRHSTTSWSRRGAGAEQLARQTASAGGQHAHDVRMSQMDDVALGSEALQGRQRVLDGPMKSLDGHRAITVDAQVDRAETARTNLPLQTHLRKVSVDLYSAL